MRVLTNFVLLVMVLATLAGCAAKGPATTTTTALPEVTMPPALEADGVFPVSPQEALRYVKSLAPARQGLNDWEDMNFAVNQSLTYASAFPASKVALRLGDRTITYGHMARTLSKLKNLLPQLRENPDLLVTEFEWLRVGPDFRFTGYFEPTLEASPVRTERFRHPLYMKPPDYAAVLKRKGKYHTRSAIENKGVLRDRGLEIAWIEDPLDGYVMQVQGSGRLRFPDGTIRYALYDGHNRHPNTMLGRIMREKGLLPEGTMSMQAIRSYFEANPQEGRKLITSIPNYVFFRLSDKGSYGSMGRILSPKVSVAVDQTVLPNGLTTFMSLYTPDAVGHPTKPFTGLMLPQDSGGAIKQHRVDFFFGNGSEAEHSAGYLNQVGAVIVLLDKNMGM